MPGNRQDPCCPRNNSVCSVSCYENAAREGGVVIWILANLTRPLRASGTGGSGRSGKTALALSTLASELAGAAHGFSLLARLLLGRLLVVVAELHLAENAFALKLLLQSAERLIHIVIANNYLQAQRPS